ncbi:MAG: glycoside hydrolase family 15 protein [Gemmataceae bacterium]
MPLRIEDYALIGDCQTVALVGADGSIDWLCFPRFDSGACFAALLGTPDNGRWLIAPRNAVRKTTRHYRADTLILETDFETDEGAVTLIDLMPIRTEQPDLVRQVVGRRGRVPMRAELTIRFDYGSVVPWVRRTEDGLIAIGGPDLLHLCSDVPFHGENFHSVAEFDVAAGQSVSFCLTWTPSHRPDFTRRCASEAIAETEAFWRDWSRRCCYEGPWRDAVLRALITLKALTYAPTGGLVAAATTSLPEQLGSVRNWDYRFCWVRDATFTLYALLMNGYTEEAKAWREWLLRAVAGSPSQINIMYGLGGERRLNEIELDWLAGYEESKPVRIGNGAWTQFQLDVFGEVMDVFHVARHHGLQNDSDAWRVQSTLLGHLEEVWNTPDEGIWEVRGPRRHFTQSKVMAWLALDRAVRDAQRYHLDGPVERWQTLRQRIHDEVCAKGFNPGLNSFVQAYDNEEVDASLLMLPLVGFLPPHDARIRGTVAAVEKSLLRDGFVQRYTSGRHVDGLPEGEGVFLLCTFWLADCYAQLGRHEDAQRLFERLLAIRNDVGLLSEEYEPKLKRMLGNFPQAFSHVGLVNTARNLTQAEGPAEQRKKT